MTRIAIESAFADSSSRAIHPSYEWLFRGSSFALRYSSPSGPIAVTLRDVLARFRPVEMGRVARENDHGAGWIGLQLTRVEFITQSDTKDAGNYRIDSILWMLMRHQLLAVGTLTLIV